MKSCFGTGWARKAGWIALVLSLQACQDETSPGSREAPFETSGIIRAAQLDEISGIQAGSSSDWIVHNDDGPAELYVVDRVGNFLATINIKGAKNRDWEDLTALPGKDGPLLVIGDTGDNASIRDDINLYFIPIPAADESGNYPKNLEVTHRVKMRYPDGARDCESLAFDPISKSLLLMSKRDVPPRLYGVGAQQALEESELTLESLGEVRGLRPPTPADLLRDPDKGAWYSQPTGMDISSDGSTAAVITYRSLYLFERREDQTWPEAFAGTPIEYIGPPGRTDEAVGFSSDQRRLVIAAEGVPSTLYELSVTRP